MRLLTLHQGWSRQLLADGEPRLRFAHTAKRWCVARIARRCLTSTLNANGRNSCTDDEILSTANLMLAEVHSLAGTLSLKRCIPGLVSRTPELRNRSTL